jgi:predicted nucleic acid-binding protein
VKARTGPTAVLVDTTVLNNFAHVRRSDLLRRVYPQAVVPPVVLAELAAGERLGIVPLCDWTWLEIAPLSADESTQARRFPREIGPGEAACLALATTRGLTLLTDDGRARAVAGSLGVEISGTLGVLAKLVREDALSLDLADELLTEMRRRGYRSPIHSLSEVL